MELRPRLAPEMAVGELLIPPQWTVDVVHHFVTSSFVGPSSFHECLTPSKKLAKGYGCSSNTLRAESLDSLGDALYVTEWFVPICHCEGEAMWEANAMQAALEAMPPRRPARPVLQARVAEITTEDLIEVSQSAHDSTEDPLTPSTSIAAHLLSSHRIFIQVVLDVLEGPSDDMERITQRILRDTIRKFLAPLEVLPQFQWFFDGKGKGAGTAQSENAERHRCSGRTLVLGRSEPTFSTVLDCKQGGALIEIDTVAVGADPCSVRCGGTPASQALQNLAVDILQLNFDGLMLTLGERLHAVTTFPVCGIPHVCSTNSASIEMAFEQHCRLCLASAGWKMEKVASPQISISLPDVLADLRNVMERMEDWNGKQSTSERLSLETRRYSSVVPTRSTFYTFTFSPAPQQKTSAFDPHIGDGSDTSTAVAFLAQLFCPMVTSNSAIVMISPLLSTDNGRYIPQARSLFHLALGGVSEWSALRHEEGSGTLYRQGQLVLKVPATHPSMDGVVVTPTAALLFNSLGSLSVTSTSSGHAAWNTAVWTLRSDCRSASEYLDYVISEYAYNTQAYNLSNVSNRSACAHNNDHVFIRRKEKPAAPQKVLSKGPHRGLKVGETWSVWIDLGPKTSRRSVYTHASEVGLSQLLIIQAVLDYSQYPIGGGQSEEDVTTRLRAEREGQLVEWINAMPVATLSV